MLSVIFILVLLAVPQKHASSNSYLSSNNDHDLSELLEVSSTSAELSHLVNEANIWETQDNQVYTYLSGDVYVGGMTLDGMRHGYGIYYPKPENYICPTQQKETRKNECPNSKRKYGHQRDGFWENDKLNGWGRDLWSNGDSHEGEWADDVPHGYGISDMSYGHHYKGTWQQGLRHGFGEFFYGSANVTYKGAFHEGFRVGIGTQHWHNTGSVVRGEWKRDKLNGFSTYTKRDGTVYKGNYENHQRSGFGVMTWPNGDKFEGQWKKDFRNGYGILSLKSGERSKGHWQDGELEQPLIDVEVLPTAKDDYRTMIHK